MKKCCAKEIRELWVICGGSMNLLRYEGACPICGGYIGITTTTEVAANDFLKKNHLPPIIKD